MQQQRNCVEPKIYKKKYRYIIETFRRNMEDNFSKLVMGESEVLLRTKEHANLQNLNEKYFSNVISSCTGKTVNQWINEKMIDEIKYLLKNSDKPMSEIALMLGFSDLNYFYSFFKRHTEIAPGKYRIDFIKFKNQQRFNAVETNLVNAEICSEYNRKQSRVS